MAVEFTGYVSVTVQTFMHMNAVLNSTNVDYRDKIRGTRTGLFIEPFKVRYHTVSGKMSYYAHVSVCEACGVTYFEKVQEENVQKLPSEEEIRRARINAALKEREMNKQVKQLYKQIDAGLDNW